LKATNVVPMGVVTPKLQTNNFARVAATMKIMVIITTTLLQKIIIVVIIIYNQDGMLYTTLFCGRLLLGRRLKDCALQHQLKKKTKQLF